MQIYRYLEYFNKKKYEGYFINYKYEQSNNKYLNIFI